MQSNTTIMEYVTSKLSLADIEPLDPPVADLTLSEALQMLTPNEKAKIASSLIRGEGLTEITPDVIEATIDRVDLLIEQGADLSKIELAGSMVPTMHGEHAVLLHCNMLETYKTLGIPLDNPSMPSLAAQEWMEDGRSIAFASALIQGSEVPSKLPGDYSPTIYREAVERIDNPADFRIVEKALVWNGYFKEHPQDVGLLMDSLTNLEQSGKALSPDYKDLIVENVPFEAVAKSSILPTGLLDDYLKEQRDVEQLVAHTPDQTLRAVGDSVVIVCDPEEREFADWVDRAYKGENVLDTTRGQVATALGEIPHLSGEAESLQWAQAVAQSAKLFDGLEDPSHVPVALEINKFGVFSAFTEFKDAYMISSTMKQLARAEKKEEFEEFLTTHMNKGASYNVRMVGLAFMAGPTNALSSQRVHLSAEDLPHYLGMAKSLSDKLDLPGDAVVNAKTFMLVHESWHSKQHLEVLNHGSDPMQAYAGRVPFSDKLEIEKYPFVSVGFSQDRNRKYLSESFADIMSAATLGKLDLTETRRMLVAVRDWREEMIGIKDRATDAHYNVRALEAMIACVDLELGSKRETLTLDEFKLLAKDAAIVGLNQEKANDFSVSPPRLTIENQAELKMYNSLDDVAKLDYVVKNGLVGELSKLDAQGVVDLSKDKAQEKAAETVDNYCAKMEVWQEAQTQMSSGLDRSVGGANEGSTNTAETSNSQVTSASVTSAKTDEEQAEM